jgi:hypothetical protein
MYKLLGVISLFFLPFSAFNQTATLEWSEEISKTGSYLPKSVIFLDIEGENINLVTKELIPR